MTKRGRTDIILWMIQPDVNETLAWQTKLVCFYSILLNKKGIFFIKMGHSRPLFLYLRLFNTVESKQMFILNFADDWIRTEDLWYFKCPLYQLSHTTAL